MNGIFSSLLVNKLISNGKEDRRLKENHWMIFPPSVEEIFLHTTRDRESISCLLTVWVEYPHFGNSDFEMFLNPKLLEGCMVLQGENSLSLAYQVTVRK